MAFDINMINKVYDKMGSSIDKAKSILNWSPKVSRSEGLKITYDYFKNLPEQELYKKEHDFKNFNKN